MPDPLKISKTISFFQLTNFDFGTCFPLSSPEFEQILFLESSLQQTLMDSELKKNLEDKNQTDNPSSSCNSVSLAQNLISSGLIRQKRQTQKLLITLKERKNNNYEKFSKYIADHLESQGNLKADQSTQCLKFIGQISFRALNHQAQLKSIASGFSLFWEKSLGLQEKNIRQQFSQVLLKKYFNFRHEMSEIIAKFLSKFIEAKLKLRIKEIINDHLKFNESLESAKSRQCCNLIHFLDLYDQFSLRDLANIASKAKLIEILSFFTATNHPGRIVLKELCSAYISKKLPHEDKDIKKLIKEFNLDSADFPSYIKVLHKKCIRYYFTTEPIFVTDLKVAGRPDLIQCLIQELIDSNRTKDALHFINKYQMKQFYYLRGNSTTCRPNFLLTCDDFLPTQLILSKSQRQQIPEDYVKLSDFQLTEKDVIMINHKNWAKYIEKFKAMLECDVVGLDSENNPSFSSEEEKKISIIQLAPFREKKVSKVYIVDFLDLKGLPQFQEWFICLIKKESLVIIGHTIKLDILEILKQLQVQTKILAVLHDIAKIFRDQNPHDLKSSLDYICMKVLKKKLSKYQQCSGWQNRPLRKAQLHYGALDAVVPVKISFMLQ